MEIVEAEKVVEKKVEEKDDASQDDNEEIVDDIEVKDEKKLNQFRSDEDRLQYSWVMDDEVQGKDDVQ